MAATVTITISTDNAGDVEVTERTLVQRFGESDANAVAGLLSRAAARALASYTPTTTED
jgi:hypothetical protein